MEVTPFIFEHTVKAPRQKVWEAWTSSEAIAQWSAPEGFTIKVEKNDVRPGGSWRIIRSINGADFISVGDYQEVIEQEKIVSFEDCDEQTAKANPGMPRAFTSIGRFSDTPDGGTKITVEIRYQTEEDRQKHLAMQPQEGWESTFKQFDKYLAKNAS